MIQELSNSFVEKLTIIVSMNSLAQRYHDLLRRFNLNYEQLGRIMGVKKQTVSNYINKETLPSRDAMRQLRERLGVSEQWLVTGKGNMLEKEIGAGCDDELLDGMNAAVGKIAQLDKEKLGVALNLIDALLKPAK